MANLAEGFERGTDRDFLRFVQIARGSCAEVRSHLYAARDAGYIEADLFKDLWTKADEVGRITHGLRTAIARRLAAR